ncbi:hypothetical protein ACFOW4_16860 [Micromonospora sp. GCM10011542]|uniref:hypothetical protein n=1 Tax=Micromonospora sp. GCM10011542 TaxID=3317337 RepID=UPI0036085E83
MEPWNVNRRFEQLRAAGGLDWLHLHDPRHGFATFLLDQCEELRTVDTGGSRSAMTWFDLRRHAGCHVQELTAVDRHRPSHRTRAADFQLGNRTISLRRAPLLLLASAVGGLT